MADFVKELSECRCVGTRLPFFPEKIKGYTDAEIQLIAEKYNVIIQGQFKEFLVQMGNCSGGLLWGDDFSMYNHNSTPENLQQEQNYLRSDDDYISCPGSRDPIEGKAFYLHQVNELTTFYYLFTADVDDYVTYYTEDLDRNVKKTTVTLLEQLKHYVITTTERACHYDFNWSEEKIDKMITGRLL